MAVTEVSPFRLTFPFSQAWALLPTAFHRPHGLESALLPLPLVGLAHRPRGDIVVTDHEAACNVPDERGGGSC